MYKLEFSCTTPKAVISTGLKDGKYRYKLNPNYEKELIEMKNAGIKNVELSRWYTMYADETLKMLKRVLRLVKKHKFTVTTVHMPYTHNWIDLASPWENDRKEIVNWIYKRIFKITDKLNPKAYIFHPGGNGAKPENREKFVDALLQSVEELSKLTAVPICVENMVGGNMTNGVNQIKEYAEKTKNGYVIIDVNHFLNEDRGEDAILAIGDKVKALHISDNDFVYERHMMPGDGLNDWNKIIGALEKIGYNGTFNYELNVAKYKYPYKDIVENYEKLFKEYNESKAK